jgi:hypothetical protein
MVALQLLLDKSERENSAEVHAALSKEIMRQISGGKFDLDACVSQAKEADAKPRRQPVAGPGRDRQVAEADEEEPPF